MCDNKYVPSVCEQFMSAHLSPQSAEMHKKCIPSVSIVQLFMYNYRLLQCSQGETMSAHVFPSCLFLNCTMLERRSPPMSMQLDGFHIFQLFIYNYRLPWTAFHVQLQAPATFARRDHVSPCLPILSFPQSYDARKKVSSYVDAARQLPHLSAFHLRLQAPATYTRLSLSFFLDTLTVHCAKQATQFHVTATLSFKCISLQLVFVRRFPLSL